jgi:hypothetical protein
MDEEMKNWIYLTNADGTPICINLDNVVYFNDYDVEGSIGKTRIQFLEDMMGAVVAEPMEQILKMISEQA